MIVEYGICRIALPIFAVFAVQPWNSAEYPPEMMNSWSTAFLQTSALELFTYFDLYLLRQEFLFQSLVESVLQYLV